MRITGNDNGSMSTLKKSQTGRKLLAEAEKRGVNIQFKANNGDNTMGQYNPNNKTITVEQGSLEQMTEVLGHELVHASTPENGNSMNEEKMAFILGEKVSNEAGVNKTPHSDSFWNNHVNNAYSGLKNDNGIMSALSALDLAANEATAANTATNKTATNATNADTATNNTATNATDTGNTAANATPAQENNPFDIANNNGQQTQQNNPKANFMQMMMQFFMMMMQMMMQIMQNQPGNNQNQQQNTQQNAQLNPFAFQALNVSA